MIGIIRPLSAGSPGNSESLYLSSQSCLDHVVWSTTDKKHTPPKHLKVGASIGILPSIDIHIKI